MSQPQLYQNPPKPGYLGGYNWPAVAVGLLVLVLANFFCTQYIANRFQYQPALGPPLVRLRAGAIYQPFAWAKWGWQHLTDQDPAIRMPFLLGMLVLVAGCFLSVGVFFAMTNRRARRLSMNAEHLHGSARWAEETDVRTTGLFTADDGVFVGGWSAEGKHLLPAAQRPGTHPGQLEQLENAIYEARAETGDNRRIVKELEKSKKRLATKLKQRADRERKDKTITFEELGIDQLSSRDDNWSYAQQKFIVGTVVSANAPAVFMRISCA